MIMTRLNNLIHSSPFYLEIDPPRVSASEMTEEANQDDEWNGDAEEQ
jgi:hypothetical protein